MSKSTLTPTSNVPRWHQPLDDAFSTLDGANQYKPSPDSWGYLAHHSGMACGPVSFGVFIWFESFEAMLQGLVQGEIPLEYENSGLDTEQHDEMRALQKIADAFAQELTQHPEDSAQRQIICDAACKAFSQVLDFLEFEWLGQFHQLTTGQSDFAQTIRSDFRESIFSDEAEEDMLSELSLPIAAAEHDQFIQRLAIWQI